MKVNQFLALAAIAVCGIFSSFAQTWTPTSAPTNAWKSMATSADGTKLVAIIDGGGVQNKISPIYTSTDSGVTWTYSSTTSNNWYEVASSADGVKLIAIPWNNGNVYISTNSGLTWISNNTPNVSVWGHVASSADGNKLMALGLSAFNGNILIYTSTNLGTSWTQTGSPNTNWNCIACSADGNTIIAGVYGYVGNNLVSGPIYTSTNGGVEWTQTSAPSSPWRSVASSVDGGKLIAAATGSIYTSTNAGITWIPSSLPIREWECVASSADGSKFIAANWDSKRDSIYISTNSGVSWSVSNSLTNLWTSIAFSADGSKVMAAAGNYGLYSILGEIWILQTTPSPSVNLTPTNGNLALSWTIPSTDFVLQHSSDLASWSDVTNVPVLNLNNLQNQITLPLPDSNSFFRLKTP